MPYVIQHLESMHYDGTNGADVAAWLHDSATLVADDGTTLTLNYCGSDYEVPAGGYVIGSGTSHSFYSAGGPDDYAAAWVELPS